MGAPFPMRRDVPAEDLRRLARHETAGRGGVSAARVGNAVAAMPWRRQRARRGWTSDPARWATRFNATGAKELYDPPTSGRPIWLGEGTPAAFKVLVLRGPDVERDGSGARAKDLCRMVEQRFGGRYSDSGMLRDLLPLRSFA